jgi:beta-1,4-mannosyl-glycoprotein beta-1,4-N-acetylglucosaminyltransferase
MLYDCFSFFNELELLELRLNELSPVVDKFVIVEATKTFQKKDKPLVYLENKDRFRNFSDKIIHIVVDKFPGFFYKFRIPNAWDYGDFQKDQVIRGLTNSQPDDILIISDIDEIPRPDKIIQYKNSPGIKIFEQNFYYYFLNGLSLKKDNSPDLWRGTVMLQRKDFSSFKKARMMRDKEGKGITIIKNGGWHFSYLGGVEKIIHKIEALEHTEFNKDYYKDPSRLEEIINSGKDLFDRDSKYQFVSIDESFPAYLRNNMSKFEHLIKK